MKEVTVEPRYTRIDDHTLDDNLKLLFPTPERNPTRAAAEKTLGVLNTLPVELLLQTVAQLDVRTLVDFRYVNRSAAELVDALQEYKHISKHAPNTIRGILAIGAGRWTTCEDIYEALCRSDCEECRSRGGYLYLPTCKRVCFHCFSENERYQPLRHEQAQLEFGLDRETVDDLPRIKIIPGSYYRLLVVPDESTQIDYQVGLNAGIARHGSLAAMKKYVADKGNPEFEEWDAAMDRAIDWGLDTSHLRPPASYREDLMNTCMRFAVTLRIPWIDKASQELDWGFPCSGCMGQIPRPKFITDGCLRTESFEHM
jgi:hypothetical protein